MRFSKRVECINEKKANFLLEHFFAVKLSGYLLVRAAAINLDYYWPKKVINGLARSRRFPTAPVVINNL